MPCVRAGWGRRSVAVACCCGRRAERQACCSSSSVHAIDCSPARLRRSVPRASYLEKSSFCCGVLAAHRLQAHDYAAPYSSPSYLAHVLDGRCLDFGVRWGSSNPTGSHRQTCPHGACGGQSPARLLPLAAADCSLTPVMSPYHRRWPLLPCASSQCWAHATSRPPRCRHRCPMSSSGTCVTS